MEKVQRRFGAGIGLWLREAAGEEGCTRSSLARGLCEVADWRNAKGDLCLASARRALPALAADLGVRLPPPRPRRARASLRSAPADSVPDIQIEALLGDLGTVRLEPVADVADGRAWRAMMALRHPLGAPVSPGARLRYWIVSERHGRLGGIGFRAGGWHLKERDEFIGWRPAARAANIGRLVDNDRFLILPSVRVPNLASRVLALATARLPADWEAAHAVRPLAAYTHTDPMHAGTCYLAAGWFRAGETSGLRGTKRRIWVRPLAGNWREELGRPPARSIGWAPEPALPDGVGWAAREYARSTHPDTRIRDRIARMGEAWEKNPGRTIPAMFPGYPERKAAHRLLSNPEVSMEDILEPHLEATAERCRREPAVLAVQDTTTLNYNGLGSSRGRAKLGGSGTSGLAAHFCLVVSEDGRPLGVLSLDADSRGKGLPESGCWLDGFDRAEELARACPGVRVVVVCDREGDNWDLLRKAADGTAELLVRACRSKLRRVRLPDGGSEDLREFMAARPVLARTAVRIEARGGSCAQNARRAKLEIRAARVALQPSANRAGEADLTMLAVSAVEANPPAGAAPASWLLLASGGEARAGNAIKAIHRYRKRCAIKEFFRVLKTELRVEERRFIRADDPRKCLAFDAATACRVFDIARVTKETPRGPALQTA